MVADRLQAELVEEAAQRARVREVGGAGLRRHHPAGGGVRHGAAGVGGVLVVAGELDLLEAQVRQELEQFPPAAGQRHQRAEIGRVFREVGPAQVAHGGRLPEGGARRDADARRHVPLGERDRAHLARRDEPAVGRTGRRGVQDGHRAERRERRRRGGAGADDEPAPADPVVAHVRSSFRSLCCTDLVASLGRRVGAHGTPTPAPPNSSQLRLKKLLVGPPGTGRNTR